MSNDGLLNSKSATARINRPRMFAFLATFAFAWLMIGLFTGTIVLVVLVRWLLNLLQLWGMGQTAQNRTLMSVIVLFIIGSFMLTRYVVRRLYRIESPRRRRITVASLLIPGVLSLWAWSNPTRVLASMAGGQRSSVTLAGGPEFIFGAYPDADQLLKLKQQGVATVVSLQHPAVLVELQGIRQERENAKRLGLKFVQVPMLPWVSDNTDALATIRQLALTGHGKYYVHCGLGRDRVNIAKRVIESLQTPAHATVVASSGLIQATGFDSRESGKPFQRGKLIKIASDVWMIPFPNAQELYGYILQGRPGHVFLLLDPRDTLQQRWRAAAEKQMRAYAVPFTVVPFSPSDTARAQEVAATIQREKPPVTIIVPATTWGDPTKNVTAHVTAAMLKALGAIPATAEPKFTLPDTSEHERTLEMLDAARLNQRHTPAASASKRP